MSPWWNPFKNDQSCEGPTWTDNQGRVWPGRGPDPKPTPTPPPYKSSGPQRHEETHTDNAASNEMRDHYRQKRKEWQSGYSSDFGNPPGYDEGWAKREGFTDWDEYWSRPKKGLFSRKSDAQIRAENIFNAQSDITHKAAAKMLHPDRMPEKYKQAANDTLAELNNMIDKRDGRR